MTRPLDLRGAHGAWQMLAELHRPTDQAGIAAAVRQLAAQGLKSHDIAHTLKIGLSAVDQLLRQDVA